MSKLHDLYFRDKNKFYNRLIVMSNDSLLAELDDTVDFDILPYAKEILSNQGIYNNKKIVFYAIRNELVRRLKNIPVEKWPTYQNLEIE